MKYRKPLLIVLSLVLSIVVLMTTLSLPSTQNDKIDLEHFSAERAMGHMELIAERPHPIGSEDNERVRNYLVGELNEMGLSPEIQSMYVEKYLEKWNVTVSGHVNNIIAKMEGSGDADGAILLASHYDTVDTSPGAADATSGVVTILECLRAVRNNGALKNDIIILLSDGEEQGMLGAMAFAEENDLVKDVSVVINLEARGNDGKATMFETGEGNIELIKLMNESVDQPFAFSATYEIYKVMSNDTDYSVFKEMGIDGLNFANLEGAHTYHQMSDNPENYNVPTLQHYGDSILALVTQLGNSTLHELVNEDTNSIYFSLSKGIFVNYSEKLALPFAVITTMVFAFIALKIRKLHGLRIRKLFLGVVINIITLVVVYFTIAPMVIPMYSMLMTKKGIVSETMGWYSRLADVSANMPLMLILLAITVLLLLLATFLMRKFMCKSEMVGSAITLWILLMIVTSLSLKGISYMFTWTTLIFLVYYGFDNLMISGKRKDIIISVLLFLKIMVVVNVYGLFIYLIYLGLTFMMASVVMVAIALYGIVLMAVITEEQLPNESIANAEKLVA
ncbi:MAG: M20/M25/M40 family metallo-hydrolase [Clostridiales bacterium]|nr:M20/M25/M40 family metallo-hydrolase [Clostridiales bacterium]